jgi:hypothetical protein
LFLKNRKILRYQLKSLGIKKHLIQRELLHCIFVKKVLLLLSTKSLVGNVKLLGILIQLCWLQHCVERNIKIMEIAISPVLHYVGRNFRFNAMRELLMLNFILYFILPHFFVQMLSSAFLQPLRSHIFTCLLRLTLERGLHTDLTDSKFGRWLV